MNKHMPNALKQTKKSRFYSGVYQKVDNALKKKSVIPMEKKIKKEEKWINNVTHLSV